MAQIKHSIVTSFEQLRLVDMELDLLKHQASLSQEQIAKNKAMSQKPEPGSLPPLQLQTITREMVENIGKKPYMMRPVAQDDDGESIVKTYKDPEQRVIIQKDTVDGRIDERQQYKDQVFRPGWNLPTKTLDELAQEEMEDALERQRKD